MISRTKCAIDNETIRKLFVAAGIGEISGIFPMGAGEYNAVYSVQAGSGNYALKIAPDEAVPVMAYEKDLMASELFWYEQMREHTPIRVPKVFCASFDKTLIPASYFIMEKLPGIQMDKMDFAPGEKAASTAELAKMAAQIHRVKKTRFGYLQNGLHDT